MLLQVLVEGCGTCPYMNVPNPEFGEVVCKHPKVCGRVIVEEEDPDDNWAIARPDWCPLDNNLSTGQND